MCTFDEICNVGNIPKLREETALNICAWKAEHEDMYAEFKKKMDNISVGDTSALESMFDLVCDCLPDELVEDDNPSLPGYGSPDDIWDSLPQTVAELQREVSSMKALLLQSLHNGQNQQKKENTHRLMSVEEAAEYLRMPKNTLYKKLQSGEVPASKLGKCWKIYQDELDKWLEVNRKNKWNPNGFLDRIDTIPTEKEHLSRQELLFSKASYGRSNL